MYRRWGIPDSTAVTGFDMLESAIRRTHLTPYDRTAARTTMTKLTHVSLFSGIGDRTAKMTKYCIFHRRYVIINKR